MKFDFDLHSGFRGDVFRAQRDRQRTGELIKAVNRHALSISLM